MLALNLEQFATDGYLILRKVVPPTQLQPLRDCFEALVEKQKAIWARDRGPNDPPGGAWETQRQPRLHFQHLVDADTSAAAEFCFHENTLGVSHQLTRAQEAAPTGMMLMCNPVRDHGPAEWHRDIHPIDQAPLAGLQTDLVHNAPGYVQWNIPLYDDNVLWVMPGSHRRLNTDEENRQLLANRYVPLPNAIPVELAAGDGVVYANTILHWASQYNAVLRRTVHLGYRALGGPIFPYVALMLRNFPFLTVLSPAAQASHARALHLYNQECATIIALYRAMLDKDGAAFQTHLATIHPGESGRMTCVVLLCKLAQKLNFGAHPKRAAFGGDLSQDVEVRPHFTPAELATLWARFTPLDARLQAAEEQFVPAFQSQPMRYYFNEMPAWTVDDFIASWN